MRCLALFLLSLFAVVLSGRGDVLYDNTTMRSDPERFADSDYEFGEEIVLPGQGSYTVTNFLYEYFGYGSSFGAGQVMVTLRFYANDGPLGTPGTLLFDSGYYPIPATSSAGSVLAYGGLGVTVPKSFTWTVDFVGLSGGGVGLQSAGLGLYGIPTVGLTYDDYWERSGASGAWELRVPVSGQPAINFGCKVEGTYVGAPSVTGQPVGTEACLGDTVTLNVTPIGTAPLAYQWYKGTSPVSGATLSNLTLTAVTGAESGDYTVRISNFAGSVTSAVASVVVNGPATLVTQPVGGVVCPGSTVVLNAAVTGCSPITYQWYRGATLLTGATQSSLTLSAVTLADSGNYILRASNPLATVDSAAAVVSVITPPTVTSQPVGANACPGQTVVLSVAASGAGSLAYQWFKGGTPVPGASASSFTIPSASAGDADIYFVRVTNCGGSTISAPATVAVQTVVPMTGVVVYDNSSTRADPARFTEADFEFGDEIILAGSGSWTLTQFSFEYFGYGSDFTNGNVRVALRFYLNNGVAGIPGTKIYDSGFFAVPPTSIAGSVVTVGGFNLSVPGNFTWTVEFIGIGAGSGGGAQAGGLDLYGPPTVGNNYDDYWERSGPGLTWVLRGPAPGQPAVSFGARAVATVTGAPYVTRQPASVTVCRGDRVVLAPEVAGSTPPTYQWYFGATPLTGETNLNLVIPFVDVANTGNYTLRAFTCVGNVISKPAAVSLADPLQSSPCLHVTRGVTPGNAVVSWTSFYGASWTLQTAESIALSSPPFSWTAVPTSPTLVDGMYRVTLPATGTNRFFRLLGP